ncbi:MAG: thrombospondin type 3 repeat-containing protein [Saprospiraceae bacterium]|nr:thrombospondin type 3 repeat-containing protein [Candidatus Vicinibacter affinis]MBK8641414.1 thrombospondin type 3 repeat-containing protein [Candidatus Vicinibacter affinis]MBK9641450.1 thrombospondin type 3 repeat-containing protein [Candidatus Vicinibacter affinis]HQX44934.1 OmpA family protein [Saprospiraceae bacterium]
MKRRFCSLIFSLALVAMLSAQDLPVNTLTLKPVWINYKAPHNDNKGMFTDLTNAFEVGYNRHFGNMISLGVPFRIGIANFPIFNKVTNGVDRYTDAQFYTGVDALLNLHLWRGKGISPFFYGGIGGALQNFDNFYVQAPVGLGLDFRISDQFSVVAQGDYRYSFKDGYDNYQYALGVRANLGCKAKDTDKDGVPDKTDKCPEVPGTVMGCPDADGDGISDMDDKCPNLAGVVENMGCPSDRDKDGVYDVDDLCPDLAGTLKGCPDSDKDGVADKDDKCPQIAGTLMGCPDSDRDGIADKDDKCPNEPGPASNAGCPNDRDKDGVEDAKDPCPDTPGKFNGCPDTDGDGLADNLDKCPNTPGIAANNGCPEIKKEDKKVLDVAMRNVQFTTGTATLTKASYKNLNDVINVLKKYPEMMLNIEGHTDDVGEDVNNQKLSERRANACMNYITSKGIVASRLMASGYGESKPIGDNKTSEGRKSNRRTEFNPVWR